ncbi:MAG: hypothetical protein AAF628_15040 [Planctomycetota bacterium]
MIAIFRRQLVFCGSALLCSLGAAQDAPAPDGDAEHQLRVEPPSLTLPVGQKAQLSAEILDIGGRPVEGDVFFFSRARRSVRVGRDGEVMAVKPGTFEVVARSMIAGERGPQATVEIIVPQPEPAKIALDGAPAKLFVGTSVRLVGAVLDKNDVERTDLEVELRSSDPAVAALDPFGHVTGLTPGQVVIRARGGGLSQDHRLEVVPNPVARLTLDTAAEVVRTGDVVRFDARTFDGSGAEVKGVPVLYTFVAQPDDTLGNAATGQIEQDGRFVGEKPGLYTVIATCGAAVARRTVRCTERFPEPQRLVKVGHGPVLDVHTSDLWVWEGVDGRDYCVTGTWGADGEALFWDVTDPSRIERIAAVKVDARTVNDVKVSEDGRLCVLSREGASNRKNGIVLIDVEDPRKPSVLAEFTDELTGGVHNLFIDKGYVYALSAGRRYDVIDVRQPKAPTKVGSFQLFEPGASIHDVWVEDGIAYSSNWRYGLRLVDVGNGIAGGSPSNPVEFGNYAYPSGWNHAAFPFNSPDTGKFYVLAGDEAFPYGLNVRNDPTYPRGWVHFVDFSDLQNPSEVARYEVPEAGTHNLWIEGTTLYVAYYNGGVRVVDISGDLMGDLYRQGREIAWFLPTHPKGVVPNAPMVWGPQPYKGHIFFSDWNSGLWAVKLVEGRRRRRG